MGTPNHVDTAEFADRPYDLDKLRRTPIACYYAMLLGGLLTALGIAGLIPGITTNGTLLGFYHVSTLTSIVYLISGVLGLVAWRLRDGKIAAIYAALMVFVFVVVFSYTQTEFENVKDAPGASGGHAIVPQFQRVLADGLHITIAMTAFLALIVSSLQAGARATIVDRRQRELRQQARFNALDEKRLPTDAL